MLLRRECDRLVLQALAAGAGHSRVAAAARLTGHQTNRIATPPTSSSAD